MARILIVDDEPLIALMVEDWLLELGHAPIGPAHDLAGALSLAQTQLDAAIIDVSLGKDTGYPVARALAAKKVPFAFATGHASAAPDPSFRPRAILNKPFAFDVFRSAVDAMLAPAPDDTR
jgi:CheY-like chemotaxis protein